MNATLEIFVEGIGLWSNALPGWFASSDVLCGKVDNVAMQGAQPLAEILPPTERRRAPHAVRLALDVAQQACAMARRAPRDLANVFASAYGDLAINDYLCATLARAPREVSPTKFHNSVHNAAAGYWSIATGCMHASTALSAGAATFGAGLLEAVLLARSESTPVLFVASDIAAVGPLADAIACTTAFGVALVLAPDASRAGARICLQVDTICAPELAPDAPVLHAVYHANPIARSLPLLIAMARCEARDLRIGAGSALSLHMEISPWVK